MHQRQKYQAHLHKDSQASQYSALGNRGKTGDKDGVDGIPLNPDSSEDEPEIRRPGDQPNRPSAIRNEFGAFPQSLEATASDPALKVHIHLNSSGPNASHYKERHPE